MKGFLIYLFQSGICLSFFGGVYLLFLRRQTSFKTNRMFLVIGLATSFILPTIQLSYDVMLPFSNISNPIHIQSVADRNTGTDIWIVTSIIYALGVVTILIRNLTATLKLKKIKREGKVIKKKGYSIVDSAEIPTPFSVLNSIYIDTSKLQQKEKEIILEHEINHIKQKHWMDLLCSECALLLQWFNPLMWLYIHLLKENHEYLADEAVLKSGESTAVYGAVLINQRFQSPVFSFSNSFNYSKHQNRLTMMKKMKTSPWKKIAVFAVLPLIGAFLALSAKPNYVFEEQIAADKVNDTIIINLKSIPNTIQVTGNITEEKANEIDLNSIASVNVIKLKGSEKKEKVYITKIDTKDQTKTLDYKKVLVIIDEVEMSPDQSLEDIDPNTIESISVLKGQTATDIYGEKGKNGVIIVTTKKEK